MAKVKWFWTVVFVCQGLGGSLSYGRNSPKNDTSNETEFNLNQDVKSAEEVDSVLVTKVKRLNPILNSGFASQTYSDFKRTADTYLTQVPKTQNDSREYLLNDARKIGYHLREISNEELGVTAMQAAFDNSQFPPSLVDPSEDVRKISKRLQDKVEQYLNILNKNRMAVESLYQHHLSNPLTEINQCCKMSSINLKYDDHFGVAVSKESTCDTVPLSLPYDAFLPGANLSKVFKQNLQDHPAVKWQYFISTAGVHSEFPAYNLETELGCKLETEARHRNVYYRTIQPYAKHVVIVIDHGNSMSPFQLATAKTIGKFILSSLSHHDKVGLIGLAGEAQFPLSGGCHSRQMAHVTYETKYQFSRFIDGLQKTTDGVNHLMGFKRAFEMIHNTLNFGPNSTDSKSEALIVYISRGLLSSIADAKVIMESIAKENHNTSNRVIINTYTILEEGKPVTFEKTFLQDLAEQNYKQYHIDDIPNDRKTTPGVMVAVNSTENLSYMIGNFLSVLSLEMNPGIHFSLPHWDTIGKGLVISITRPVYHASHLLGVVGVDIPVADLADGVTYYGQLPHSYAFLMEETGVAIMHPSFPRPSYTSGQPMHTDIWHLEQRGDTRRIKRDIMKQAVGEEKVVTNSSNTPLWRNGFDIESDESVSLQYNWRKVDGTPYTICIVTSTRKERKRGKLGKGSPRPAVFTYHRLDLVPPATPVKLCRHLKQLSTTDVSTVFLSAATFESPFDYLLKEETPEMADRYLSYLHDMTGTITNPGLKESVRRDVLTVAIITDHWKKKLDNEFSKYTVRKYLATQGGVFVSFPGTVIDKTYDPTKRDWFTRALEFPGRVIVSAPYLDVGGAGYIVTLSSVILEGKYASMHSTSDPIVAVMGMDLTLGYFYKLITEVISICQEDRIACFLLDDRGYLISHPSFIEPNARASAEQQHITHKEPLVAGDILNHKYFAEKKLCNSFSDRTIQRFYQFNTSTPFLTNLVQGESCAKYMMTPIPGTNIFVGIVNQTCDVITTFCPCSTTDRLCLNCHRMEQTECECPCECPLEMNLCSGQLMDENDNNPSCPRFPEEPHALVVDSSIMDNLEYCFESKCFTRNSKNECFGVLGCEWCQLESDGFTSLKKEFCTEQRKCFGGVLGARTPYADEIIGLPGEDMFSINNTPVGPVAGGVISFFLILAFAVYCYRSHINRGGSTEYITSRPDGNMHMSQMENEIDEPDANEDHIYRAPCSNIVLASFDNAAVVSPYRFATGYRRRPGGDSDPGYSTMTPHEDSEHVPYIEPLLLAKDRQRAPASQLSVSSCSRASSPLTFNPNATTPPDTGGITNVTGVLAPLRSCHSPVITNVPHHWGQMFPNSRDLTQTVIPEVQVHAQVHMADTR